MPKFIITHEIEPVKIVEELEFDTVDEAIAYSIEVGPDACDKAYKLASYIEKSMNMKTL